MPENTGTSLTYPGFLDNRSATRTVKWLRGEKRSNS